VLEHHHTLPPEDEADEARSPALDLAAMIASRMCHDLNNPLGAIGNGLELLALNGQAPSPEMKLIVQSVETAKARVQFLRVAFGTANRQQRMSGPEVAAIIAAHAGGGRVRIDWQAPGEADRGSVRLAFLLLMGLETALAFGGTITVTRAGGRWQLVGEAERIRDLADLWAAVAWRAPLPEITPSLVHFALAREVSRAIGRPVRVVAEDGLLSAGF
jgi:histidine phosphotransferase ChpT